MMPFSVLRVFGLGLFSWLLLGAAAYLLYEYADGMSPPRVVSERSETDVASDRESDVREADGERAVAIDERARTLPGDNQGGWPYLAGGLALLAVNLVGFVPVLPFLGRPKLGEPASGRTGEVIEVERPDGSRLHVEVYGSANRPLMLFTHGWSLDSTAWYYVKRQFGDRYRVVVWDLPGLGKSKAPANNDYRIEKMAGDLHAVLTRVATDEPAILIGHSIGGMITQTFCRLYPQELKTRVAGVVLLHTTYTNPVRTAWLNGLLTAIERPVLVPLNHLMIWLSPLVWLSNWQSYLNGSMYIVTRLTSFAGDQTWGQVNHGALLAAKAWPAVTGRGNFGMLEFDERASLPNVAVPTLVIGGEHDRMTLREASERIDELVPHSVETVIPAGHLGFWERNEQVAEVLQQFADKVLPNGQHATAQQARMREGV